MDFHSVMHSTYCVMNSQWQSRGSEFLSYICSLWLLQMWTIWVLSVADICLAMGLHQMFSTSTCWTLLNKQFLRFTLPNNSCCIYAHNNIPAPHSYKLVYAPDKESIYQVEQGVVNRLETMMLITPYYSYAQVIVLLTIDYASFMWKQRTKTIDLEFTIILTCKKFCGSRMSVLL